jgi:hypothetical protein
MRILRGYGNMTDQTDTPTSGKNNPLSPSYLARANPMKFITTMADPMFKRVRLFECAECRTTAFIKER